MLGHGIGSDNTVGLTNPWLNCTQALFEPRWLTRLLARGRRLALDRALAEGADPTGSPLLAARAAQLVQPGNRHRLASALEHLALAAEAGPMRVRVVPRRRTLEANRARLLELAGTLRNGGLLYARGIAILELVLIDGTGPTYTDPHGEGLARQLDLAGASLGG
jgi:hypothetical protein